MEDRREASVDRPRRRCRASRATAVLILLVAGGRIDAQNNAQFRDWKASALADWPQLEPRAACASLVTLTGYEFSIVSATVVPAAGDTPEYCRLSGQILPEVRFEVSLPVVWNGRLYMFGNGGYAGEALDSQGRQTTVRRALARGFAVAQNNTGHDATVEPLGAFAQNSQKFLDYAFRAVHVTAVTAKRLLQAYYETAPRRAYFDGCSSGGRQGLISAQRFPDDFDGILVGAPVLDFTGTMINYANAHRALAATPMPGSKMKLLAEAVYAKCDGVDGLTDGLIDDPRRCTFAPSRDLPRCADDAEGPACFTAGHIRTLETIYGGTTRNGAPFFPGQPVGAEVAAPVGNGESSGWTPWIVPSPNAPANAPTTSATFGETFFRYMAFGRPNLKYDWTSFNVDTDYDKLQWTRNALDATDPDLSRFKAHGGKIVSYFGWADSALNPLMGIRYYENVSARLGSTTTDFYRFFTVPGMFHCSGGVGVSTFDAFTPLVEWVERGTPPSSIVGSRLVNGKVVRTRPLCPYPQVARYKGTGSIDEAVNFTCEAPDREPAPKR